VFDTCVKGTLGIGTINLLLGIALLAWEIMWVADVKIAAPRALVSAGMAAGIVAFTVLKIIADSELLALAAWVGLILALLIGYGGGRAGRSTRRVAAGHVEACPLTATACQPEHRPYDIERARPIPAGFFASRVAPAGGVRCEPRREEVPLLRRGDPGRGDQVPLLRQHAGRARPPHPADLTR
jgi:hypothetical protein